MGSWVNVEIQHDKLYWYHSFMTYDSWAVTPYSYVFVIVINNTANPGKVMLGYSQ